MPLISAATPVHLHNVMTTISSLNAEFYHIPFFQSRWYETIISKVIYETGIHTMKHWKRCHWIVQYKTFFPHETKIFNDREPPWINNKVKAMIQEKKNYQLYLKNKSKMLATKLETMQNLIYETLESCKGKYYENISKNYSLKP